MNELYPIIQRARRSLIVNDAPPVAIAKVEPLQGSNGNGPAPPKVDASLAVSAPVCGESPLPPLKASDAKISHPRSAR